MSSPSEHEWALGYFPLGIQESAAPLSEPRLLRAWRLPPPISWNFLVKIVGLQIQGLHR